MRKEDGNDQQIVQCLQECECAFTVLANVGQVSDDLVGLLLLVRRGRSCERHDYKTDREKIMLQSALFLPLMLEVENVQYKSTKFVRLEIAACKTSSFS